jgi:hypothetical protein
MVYLGQLDKSTTATAAQDEDNNYDDAKASAETAETAETAKLSICHFGSPPGVI